MALSFHIEFVRITFNQTELTSFEANSVLLLVRSIHLVFIKEGEVWIDHQ